MMQRDEHGRFRRQSYTDERGESYVLDNLGFRWYAGPGVITEGGLPVFRDRRGRFAKDPCSLSSPEGRARLSAWALTQDWGDWPFEDGG